MIRAELRPECTLTLPCIYAILVIAVCAGSRAGFAAGNYTDAAFDGQNGREGIGMKIEERVFHHEDQLNGIEYTSPSPRDRQKRRMSSDAYKQKNTLNHMSDNAAQVDVTTTALTAAQRDQY